MSRVTEIVMIAVLQGECSTDEADPTQHATWLASRPPKMEYDAIKLLIRLLDEDKTPAEPGFSLHVAHLADAEALPMIEAAKKKGASCPKLGCMSLRGALYQADTPHPALMPDFLGARRP